MMMDDDDDNDGDNDRDDDDDGDDDDDDDDDDDGDDDETFTVGKGSRTKCDRLESNQFLMQKDPMLRSKIITQSDRKSQNRGSSPTEPPYHAQVWEYPPWRCTQSPEIMNIAPLLEKYFRAFFWG